MSFSLGSSKSGSSQSSKPLKPDELAAYFSQLDYLTGGTPGTPGTTARPGPFGGPGTPATPGTPGRLQTFATEGTPELTPDQIQALGGLGADRQRQLDAARREAVGQITADPNLTIAQRQRSQQLTDQDYNDRLSAILKEIEAEKTGLVKYNAESEARDLEILANIFFGGKGQTSQGSSSSSSFTFGAGKK